MRIPYLLLVCGILFSCNSNQQKNEESIVDTAQTAEVEADGVATPEAAKPQSSPAKPFERNANQLENFRTIVNYQPGKSAAELSIQDFVQRLGNSHQTIKDTDSTCPVGQLHFWNLKDQNCRIFALGDEYSSKDNSEASCRLYGIQEMNEKQPSRYEGFLGIHLGDEAHVVEQKLKDFVKTNSAYRYEQLKGRSAVERFLTDRQKSVFVLTDGQKYYHFAIGKKQKLNYILISAINVREAC